MIALLRGNKSILPHAGQGLGNTIRFCRYARLVHERVVTPGTAVGAIDFQCLLPIAAGDNLPGALGKPVWPQAGKVCDG